MNLRELTKKKLSKTEAFPGKSLWLFVQTKLVRITGNLNWDFFTEAVFCSDVMLSVPVEFEGVKGILHPDDRQMLLNEIFTDKKIEELKFRMITSYGEVKELKGLNIEVEEVEGGIENLQGNAVHKIADEKEQEHLRLLKDVYEKTEKNIQAGVWYYNTVTAEAWYSNQVFSIHDLAPQSLNAHFNTFASFIHPEDAGTVAEFIAKAYKQRIPLHIEYRIITGSREKHVLHRLDWSFSAKGEAVFNGSIQDITEQKSDGQKLDAAENTIRFNKELLRIDEQKANIGHWHTNLITRKTFYSDNLFRIYGIRPGVVPPGINSLINYIHPEDQEAIIASNKRMMNEHMIPEMDYRIIRADGKVRYISQKAKLLSFGDDLVMAGIIQDVTVERTLEKRIEELTENTSIKNYSHQQAEEMSGTAGWVWNIQSGKIAWSESFYKLLGYRPNAVELTEKRLLLFLHHEDKKRFSDELAVMLQKRKESEFEFRMVLRGEIRYMKAWFRIVRDADTDLFIGTVQDKTKEWQLAQRLAGRMKLAESLVENITDRILITNTDNTILLWNQSCEKTYGVKKEDAIGRNFFDIFPQQKTEETLQLFKRVMKSETVRLQESRLLPAKEFYNLCMVPLWNEANTEITGIIHIMHDVTKELELRQSLNGRLNFIESLIDSSVDRIIVLDRNMNYLYWNKRSESFYGINKEYVLGKNVLEIFPQIINHPTYDLFRTVLKGETVHIPECKSTRENECEETYLIPIKDERHAITSVLCITRGRTGTGT